MTCWGTYGSGLRTAGTRAMRARLLTGVRGRAVVTAVDACCVAARGTTSRGSCGPRIAAGSTPVSGTSMSGSVLPGRWIESCILASLPLVRGSRGLRPLAESSPCSAQGRLPCPNIAERPHPAVRPDRCVFRAFPGPEPGPDRRSPIPASAPWPMTRVPGGGERRTGPALEAMYQLVRWLIPTVDRFPRRQKFLLGDRPRTATETPPETGTTISVFVSPVRPQAGVPAPMGAGSAPKDRPGPRCGRRAPPIYPARACAAVSTRESARGRAVNGRRESDEADIAIGTSCLAESGPGSFVAESPPDPVSGWG